MRSPTLALVLVLSVFAAGASVSGQDAAPSSHMVSEGGFEGNILINEVRVPKDGEAMHTYYETLGWSGRAAGYAGIQAHPRGRNYIFSIWDHKEHAAPIRAVHGGAGTLTEKFGGEGTGLKSWNFELGWETDTWYSLVSRCWPVGDHTYYGYWARSGKSGEWTHLVTMDVAAKDAYFQGGNDAFIEDWLETGKNARTIHLRGCWKGKLDGGWHAFGSARYSVNAWDLTEGKRSFNFRNNWNGGVARDAEGAFYFMTAGGHETRPTVDNPSTHFIERVEAKPGYAPIRIHSAKAGESEGEGLTVAWENDPATLPQFGFRLTAYANAAATGDPLARVEKIEPHARAAALELPAGTDRKGVHLRLVCTDILGNESPAFTPE